MLNYFNQCYIYIGAWCVSGRKNKEHSLFILTNNNYHLIVMTNNRSIIALQHNCTNNLPLTLHCISCMCSSVSGYGVTCSELKMVNSQAKTTVFSLTANRPKTHVSPSRGRRITDAFTIVLPWEDMMGYKDHRLGTRGDMLHLKPHPLPMIPHPSTLSYNHSFEIHT